MRSEDFEASKIALYKDKNKQEIRALQQLIETMEEQGLSPKLGIDPNRVKTWEQLEKARKDLKNYFISPALLNVFFMGVTSLTFKAPIFLAFMCALWASANYVGGTSKFIKEYVKDKRNRKQTKLARRTLENHRVIEKGEEFFNEYNTLIKKAKARVESFIEENDTIGLVADIAAMVQDPDYNDTGIPLKIYIGAVYDVVRERHLNYKLENEENYKKCLALWEAKIAEGTSQEDCIALLDETCQHIMEYESPDGKLHDWIEKFGYEMVLYCYNEMVIRLKKRMQPNQAELNEHKKLKKKIENNLKKKHKKTRRSNKKKITNNAPKI